MQKITIRVDAPARRRRARELFSNELNFRPKTVENKRAYRRRPKHRTVDRDG
jgi:uroporphyrinogen-III synthase